MAPIRFLLSRDDWYHQRGYWVVAKALSNAGIEVILGGIQTPGEMAQTALQEGVDVMGYRIMDASPQVVIEILFEEMKRKGIEEIPVVVGGIIPQKDETFIRALGVKAVFRPFDPLEKLPERIRLIAHGGRSNVL